MKWRASSSLAIENEVVTGPLKSNVIYSLRGRHMPKSILCLLSLIENLGTHALESGHLQIHHDFKARTLRKDDIKSIRLHYEWWIQDFTNSFIFLLRTSG